MTAPAAGPKDGWRTRFIDRPLAAVDLRLATFVVYRIGRAMVREFRRAVCMQRAGEIAFYAIVAVIPFTALLMFMLVWVTETFVVDDWSSDDVMAIIDYSLAQVLPGKHSGSVTEGLAASLIDDQAALGTFGLLLMLTTASLAFGAVNRALAAIFKTDARGQLTSIFMFSILMSGIGLAIFMGLSVLAAASTTTEGSEFSKSVEESSLLVRLGADTILLGGFAYLHVMVVPRDLRWRSILFGGFFFVVCFEAARIGYEFYLSTIAQLNVVYGSLAGTMATVLWFYYVAFMFLSALCLVRVLDDRLYDAD